jgi:hypothetical protein
MGCEPLRGVGLWGDEEEYGDFADFAAFCFATDFVMPRYD